MHGGAEAHVEDGDRWNHEHNDLQNLMRKVAVD